MTSLALIIACAGLSVLILGWVLRPLRTQRAFYTLAILCAFSALGLYLVMGKPDLPAMRADDPEILIRRAAAQVLDNRVTDETLQLLDKAEKKLPGDQRIEIIRAAIKNSKQ